MIPLAPVAAELKRAGFAHVAGVLEYAGLTAPPAVTPTLFVVPDSETAAENRTNGLTDQRVAFDFRIVLVLRADARDPDRPSDELVELATRATRALTGWTHPDAGAPTAFLGGQLMSAGGHLVAWGLRFRTHYHLRRTPDGT